MPNSTSALDDPLLESLLIITRLHQRPQSIDSLCAGLPASDGHFTPALFIRAAQNVGFSARLRQRRLKQLPNRLLPAVLLLQDGQALVLVSQTQKHCRCILPEAGEGEIDISEEELNANYSGQALLIQPQFRLDERTQAVPELQRGHWYWGTLWRSWAIYAEVFLASFFINLFALAAPLFVMNVYDRVVPNYALETLWALAIGAVLVFLFDFLLRSLRGYFIDMAGKQADVLLARRIFAQVLNTQSLAQPRSAGAFASHLHEFDSFRDFFTSATLTTLIDLPFAALFLFVIWMLGGNLVLIPLLTMPLVLLVGLLLQIPLRHSVQKSLKLGAQKQASLIETLNALETIKALGAESPRQKNWEQLTEAIASSSLQSRFYSALAVNFSLLAQQVSYVGVVVYGVYLIADGSLSVGGLIACTILNGRALAPLAQVATLLTRYYQSHVALKALSQVMRQPVERGAAEQFLQRDGLQGDISLEKVSFTYPNQAQAALKAVSLHIKAGEKVAIIGRIGSGKSTIARLLLGLYQTQSGNILLDGIDSRQIDPAEKRRNMGYMPQDLHLFFGTVKDNIRFAAPQVEDASLLRAAQIAGVEDMLKRHPAGLDCPVGERGEGLSGGQRQLVALARALLLDPPILLFDEPSNAMDNHAEEQFKTRLLPYLQHKTLILITHRASLLSLVDRIVVLDQGKVVADGKKQQVLEALAQGRVKLGDV